MSTFALATEIRRAELAAIKYRYDKHVDLIASERYLGKLYAELVRRNSASS